MSLEDLNASQRMVAEWGEGPLLVLGGPGSGKTHALTLRMARLIEETPTDNFRVLALTFSQKAVADTERRMDESLGSLWESDRPRPRPATFHDYAVSIVSRHGYRIGLRPNSRVFTEEEERWPFLRRALERSGTRVAPGWSKRGLLRKLDLVMEYGADPELDDLPERYAWIAPAYAAYLDLLAEASCLDPGAALILCRRLFRKLPIYAKDQRVFYPFVSVDGIRRFNRSQYLFLRTIHSGPDANIVATADEWPSSRWNGMDAGAFHRFLQDCEPRIVHLPTNPRCPKTVIGAATRLMRREPNGLVDDEAPKASKAGAPEEALRVRMFPDEAAEVRWLAEDLGTRIRGKASPAACAVLARSRRLLLAAADALRSAGVPVQVEGTESRFESPLLRVVLSVLRLGEAPAHPECLETLCRAYGELVGSEIGSQVVEAESALTGQPLLRSFLDLADDLPESNGGASFRPVLAAIRGRVSGSLDPESFAAAMFDWAAEADGERAHEGDDANEAWEVRAFRALVEESGLTDGYGAGLGGFRQRGNGASEAPPADGVRCLTIHGARGLVFEHLYVVGMAQGELPSHRAVERGEEAIGEERRACFGAITRASGSLTMSCAGSYFGWRTEPSQFLREMPPDYGREIGPCVPASDGLVDVTAGDRVAEGSA